MPIPAARLELALRQTKTDDWYRFERLCRAFLASEVDDFRAMANSAGDGGRDGQLFAADSRPTTLYQFSVSEDWRSKIRATVKRLKKTFPDSRMLVFLSSRSIGAAGDELRNELAGEELFLDIRDETWFVDRANFDPNRSAAAQSYFDEIVTATLDLNALNASPYTLSTEESRTLLCFLELQRHDDEADKGLTRASYEALVRAALRGTSSSNKMSVDQIYDAIHRLMPRHDIKDLKPHIDQALRKLDYKVVKHNSKTNDYHLAFDEQQRLVDVATHIQTLKEGYLLDITEGLESDDRITAEERTEMRIFVSQVIELYLHRRGENFAAAINTGSPLINDATELRSVVLELKAPQLAVKQSSAAIAVAHADSILRTPSEETLHYLRLLSDCYTLFAFIAEVPDVQRVTKRIFDHGEIWLDTSILLPAFAEYAEPSREESDRPFVSLFKQLANTGLRRYVTPGVLEELTSHLQNCVRYARSTSWKSRVPYVALRFLLLGNSLAALSNFIDEFCGTHSPEADLQEFLRHELKIEVREPNSDAAFDKASRDEIVDYWQTVHEKRREGDNGMSVRLAKHDADNYINALLRRSSSSNDGYWLGYTTWWLTIDNAAIQLMQKVSSKTAATIRSSPILSLDFLTRYLSLGPLRAAAKTASNPLAIFSPEIVESLPLELVRDANSIRETLKNMSPRLRQRKIRYELDMQRSKYGDLHNSNLEELELKMRR